MELTDWVRSGSLCVVFVVVAMLSDRRAWITTDRLACLGFGAGFLLFPNMMLDFQVVEPSKLDTTHLFLGRVFGLGIACSALVGYFTKDSRDGTVAITLLIARTFACTFLLMSQIYSFMGTPHGQNYWNEQFLWFGIFGTALWLLGHLIHLKRSSDFSTYPQHNIQLNNHLRFDSWAMCIISLIMLAFPDFYIRHMFGQRSNGIHKHIVRATGSFGLGDALVSLQAPGFLHERDKKAQLCARLVWIVCLCVPWLGASLLKGMVSLEALCHLLLLYLLPLTNALVGYFTEVNVVYAVPKTD